MDPPTRAAHPRGILNVQADHLPAALLVVGTAVLAILFPLVVQFWLRWRPTAVSAGHSQAVLAALVALAGGFVLRYAMLSTSPALLAAGSPSQAGAQAVGTPSGAVVIPRFGPEDGRTAGEPGADRGNRVGEIVPRSKVFMER